MKQPLPKIIARLLVAPGLIFILGWSCVLYFFGIGKLLVTVVTANIPDHIADLARPRTGTPAVKSVHNQTPVESC